jgi:hypothetical protein
LFSSNTFCISAPSGGVYVASLSPTPGFNRHSDSCFNSDHFIVASTAVFFSGGSKRK